MVVKNMSEDNKKTERSDVEKKQLLSRINRITGQLDGIKKWLKMINIVMMY